VSFRRMRCRPALSCIWTPANSVRVKTVWTNAKEGRDVRGPHYFLVLKVDRDCCTAVPLFSCPASGSVQLDEPLKTGLPDKWCGQPSCFSQWQHWRIPLASIVSASGDEESDPATRRRYAASKPDCLNNILRWETRNHCSYRPVVWCTGSTTQAPARISLARSVGMGVSF